MFPPEIVIVPAIFGIPALVLLAHGWFRHREKMESLRRPTDQSDALDARLARIEQAVDAIAIEMERVTEGQRFVTKLMSERAPARLEPPAPQAARERVNTPH